MSFFVCFISNKAEIELHCWSLTKPIELEQQLHPGAYPCATGHMNPVYGYNYGYVQSNFNQPYYYQLPSYVPLQDTPNLVFEEKKSSKREKQAKKQRLLSGQNDSFTRSDISTETTSTNTSYSNKRANSRKNPKNKTPRWVWKLSWAWSSLTF